jgi:large exoprotein involved in heme utilization and adhesion
VNITATGSVSVTNSGIFSTVEEGAVGQGGNIDITADSLSLNNALLSSNSSGTGKAGDINVTADSISLDQGSIVAETTSGQGGNIKLQVEDVLVLRHGSLISTNAGTAQAGGDGGNITIDTTFIVAVPEENSDITANAYEGNGGRVNITAQGIFGIEFREDLTPLSDITASSDLGVNGVVEIDRPAVDPSRGLTTLPTDIVDPTGLIDRRCQIESSSATSQFTITGRGGLPPNPNDLLGEEGLLEDLGTPAAVRERVRDGKHTSIPVSPSSLPKRIVEAQGWVISPNGNVILTAQAPNATPQPPWQTPTSCKTASSPETSVPSP